MIYLNSFFYFIFIFLILSLNKLKISSVISKSFLAIRIFSLFKIISIEFSTEKTSIISFNLSDIHPHDLGTFLDRAGVAVRVGHHCAQPLLHRLGISGTVRASFYLYNTMDEAELFIEQMKYISGRFG